MPESAGVGCWVSESLCADASDMRPSLEPIERSGERVTTLERASRDGPAS
jgi:hypothetical protein